MADQFSITAIGYIHSERAHLEDDGWGGSTSTFELDTNVLPETSLEGIEGFSHLEVVFVFHKVNPDKVHMGLRRPRADSITCRWSAH